MERIPLKDALRFKNAGFPQQGEYWYVRGMIFWKLLDRKPKDGAYDEMVAAPTVQEVRNWVKQG